MLWHALLNPYLVPMKWPQNLSQDERQTQPGLSTDAKSWNELSIQSGLLKLTAHASSRGHHWGWLCCCWCDCWWSCHWSCCWCGWWQWFAACFSPSVSLRSRSIVGFSSSGIGNCHSNSCSSCGSWSNFLLLPQFSDHFSTEVIHWTSPTTIASTHSSSFKRSRKVSPVFSCQVGSCCQLSSMMLLLLK